MPATTNPYRHPLQEQEYHKDETVRQRWFAPVWGGANLVGFFAHLGSILYAAIAARLELTMETADVRPQLCNGEVATSLDNLVGVLAVEGLGRSSAFSLGWTIIAFHALSASFHLVAASALLLHACTAFGRHNALFRWYQYGLYHNLALWRWLEYFFSASIMMLILGGMMGVRELRSLQAQVGAMATVILFGWLTDLISSPLIEEHNTVVGRLTFVRRWKPHTRLVRWQAHLYGYIPYALVWVLTFRGYNNAIDAFGKWLPPASHQMVIGTFVAFTVFGVVQAVLQVLPFGPSLYAWGELVYIVLSFAAKSNLGILAITEALVDGARYDSLLFYQSNASLRTCQDYERLAPEELVVGAAG